MSSDNEDNKIGNELPVIIRFGRVAQPRIQNPNVPCEVSSIQNSQLPGDRRDNYDNKVNNNYKNSQLLSSSGERNISLRS